MRLNLTHTEEYIKTLYLELGIAKPQDLKIDNIANHFGITVFYWSEDSRALFVKKQAFILINEHLTNEQKNQDFFHELTHVLMHVGCQRKLPKLFIEYQEIKANQFMYHAAVPTFMLEDLQVNDLTETTVQLVQLLFNVDRDFAYNRLTHYLNRKRDILNWNMFMEKILVHK